MTKPRGDVDRERAPLLGDGRRVGGSDVGAQRREIDPFEPGAPILGLNLRDPQQGGEQAGRIFGLSQRIRDILL
jgi:hypothetical protein